MDRRVIAKLYQVDPQFRDVYDLLYGVAKADDPSEVHLDGTGANSTKRKATAAGLLLGTGAEGLAVARSGQKAFPGASLGRAGPAVGRLVAKLPKVHLSPRAEFGVQAANATVGLLAAHELFKKPPQAQPVGKAFKLTPLNTLKPAQPSLKARKPPRPGPLPVAKARFAGVRAAKHNIQATIANAEKITDNASKVSGDAANISGKVNHLVPRRRVAIATTAGLGAAGIASNYVATYQGSKRGARAGHAKQSFAKAELVFRGEIAKVDTDKRQVFGFCSLSEIDGQPVIDLQGDMIDIGEVEKSAYRYVLESRKGGRMHERIGKADGGPRHVADLIESFVVTPEKLAGMGLAPDALPLGWWTGFVVNDEDTWAQVKSGELAGLSIHGSGIRKDVAA